MYSNLISFRCISRMNRPYKCQGTFILFILLTLPTIKRVKGIIKYYRTFLYRIMGFTFSDLNQISIHKCEGPCSVNCIINLASMNLISSFSVMVNFDIRYSNRNACSTVICLTSNFMT